MGTLLPIFGPMVNTPRAPAPPPPPSGNPLFVGDYSTGDFSQWPTMQNKLVNGPPSSYPGGYPASIVTDPVRGSVARYEVRTGDHTNFDATAERTEVSTGSTSSGGTEGQTRWYAFSTKFDTTYPTTHAGYFNLTNQWHGDVLAPPYSFGTYTEGGSPSSTILWALHTTSTSNRGVWTTSLDLGNWHDIILRVKFSTNPAVGEFSLWHNGVAQTFASTGTTTCFAQTIQTGEISVYYKEGIYRGDNTGTTTTDIVYHTGFKYGLTQADVM